jgi:hypothetical protein
MVSTIHARGYKDSQTLPSTAKQSTMCRLQTETLNADWIDFLRRNTQVGYSYVHTFIRPYVGKYTLNWLSNGRAGVKNPAVLSHMFSSTLATSLHSLCRCPSLCLIWLSLLFFAPLPLLI